MKRHWTARATIVVAAVFLAAAAPAVAATRERASSQELRAVYLSYWSASVEERVAQVVEMARAGLINGVVIDIKSVTGRVAFNTDVEEADIYGAKVVILKNIDELVARLKREHLYVIARITVFADPILAEARPELAVHSVAKLAESDGRLSVDTLWRDRRDLAWIDPAAEAAWEYNVAIARDALSRGFDEINFDYIRFPSDGVLQDMAFPVWQAAGPKHATVRAFFAFVRERMGEAVISADLFGLSTIKREDLSIGQIIEDAYVHFDYVCPMTYPSHYAPGFQGRLNPAEFPYEVVFESMATARERLEAMGKTARARLRPWLQDFNLGADYTPEMVYAQVRATRDALGPEYAGFLLWNSRNVYREQALELAAKDQEPAKSPDCGPCRN